MSNIVSPHEQDLTQLVMECGSRIRFFLRHEHITGQVGNCLHTSLYYLKELMFCLKFINDLISFGYVSCSYLVIILAVHFDLLTLENPHRISTVSNQYGSALIFSLLFYHGPESFCIGEDLTCQFLAKFIHSEIGQTYCTVMITYGYSFRKKIYGKSRCFRSNVLLAVFHIVPAADKDQYADNNFTEHIKEPG